jgi:hypothetical protein
VAAAARPLEIRYQVFISSTYEDLRFERQQATQAILEMGHMPAGMELFPASDMTQWDLIKKVIEESDYYIVIVSGRYGTVSPITGLSYTEMEYDYAVSQGIPVLGFVRGDVGSIEARYVETDKEKLEKLEAFRSKVKSRICRMYGDPTELGLQIMKSLMSELRLNPKTGWIRADQARSQSDIDRERELASALAESQSLISTLERQLHDSAIKIDDLKYEDMAQGSDVTHLTIHYIDSNKTHRYEKVELTWDEIFSVIGPRMFGYIVRRVTNYQQQDSPYSFEDSLVQFIRLKANGDYGNRKIEFLPHEIDSLMLQFKQLGYVKLSDKIEKDGSKFRGYELTAFGERYLTCMAVQEVERDIEE